MSFLLRFIYVSLKRLSMGHEFDDKLTFRNDFEVGKGHTIGDGKLSDDDKLGGDYMLGGSYMLGGDITTEIIDGGCDSRLQMQDLLQALLIALIIVVCYCLCQMVYSSAFKKSSGGWKRMMGGASNVSTEALASAGWYLYTRPGCSWCHKQIDALGGSYANRIECGKDGASPAPPAGAPACTDPKISGYPFWYNATTGQSRTGFQNSEALLSMAGGASASKECPPPKECPPADCTSCTPEICASCAP